VRVEHAVVADLADDQPAAPPRLGGSRGRRGRGAAVGAAAGVAVAPAPGLIAAATGWVGVGAAGLAGSAGLPWAGAVGAAGAIGAQAAASDAATPPSDSLMSARRVMVRPTTARSTMVRPTIDSTSNLPL
jgi:hypothetical protein